MNSCVLVSPPPIPSPLCSLYVCPPLKAFLSVCRQEEGDQHGKNSAGSGSGTAPFCQQLFPDPSPVLARNRVDIFNHLCANNSLTPHTAVHILRPLLLWAFLRARGSGTREAGPFPTRMQEVMMMMVIHPSVSCPVSSVGKAWGKEGWALAPHHGGKPSRSGLSAGLPNRSRSLQQGEQPCWHLSEKLWLSSSQGQGERQGRVRGRAVPAGGKTLL